MARSGTFTLTRPIARLCSGVVSQPISGKTIFAFLGLVGAVFVVSFGLLLVAGLTGSAIWIWASLAVLGVGVLAAVFWLVGRLRKSDFSSVGAVDFAGGGRWFERPVLAVRQFVLNAQWWQLSLVIGLIAGPLYGGGMWVVQFSREGRPSSWISGLLAGVLFGVLFGAIGGPLVAWQSQRIRSVLGPQSGQDYPVVLRAAGRGPVPADPELRRAAGRLAAHQLDVMTRMRVFTLPVLGLFCVLEAIEAVVTSAWYWLAAAFFAFVMAQSWWWRRRLRRRVELLADPATQGG